MLQHFYPGSYLNTHLDRIAYFELIEATIPAKLAIPRVFRLPFRTFWLISMHVGHLSNLYSLLFQRQFIYIWQYHFRFSSISYRYHHILIAVYHWFPARLLMVRLLAFLRLRIGFKTSLKYIFNK